MSVFREEEVIVVDTEHYQGSVATAAKSGSTSALLVREPNNPHDKNAVMVSAQGQCIGYISAGRAEKYALIMDAAGQDSIATSIQFRDGNIYVTLPAPAEERKVVANKSVAIEIKELESLLYSRVISQEEFDSKRAELLGVDDSDSKAKESQMTVSMEGILAAQKKPWYKEGWGLAFAIFFFPFFIVWWAWAKSDLALWQKIAITATSIAFIAIVINISEANSSANDSGTTTYIAEESQGYEHVQEAGSETSPLEQEVLQMMKDDLSELGEATMLGHQFFLRPNAEFAADILALEADGTGAEEWHYVVNGLGVLSQGIYDLLGEGYLVHILDPNYEDGHIPVLSARDGHVFWDALRNR